MHYIKYTLFAQAWLFAKHITFTKVRNYILSQFRLNLAKSHYKTGMPAMPWSLTIEPVSVCNLRCVECPVGTYTLYRNKGRINLDLYTAIIHQSAPYLLNLFLYFQGESFIHPQIISIIKKATEKNIYTVISTNGHYISQPMAESIILSKLSKIIISLDGHTQELYEKYRVGGDIEKVKAAIKNLSMAKQKYKTIHPVINVQCLITAYTEPYLAQIKTLAYSLGANIFTAKTLQVYNNGISGLHLVKNLKNSRYITDNSNNIQVKQPIKNRCKRLYNSAVVTFDGNVVPCCFDKDATYTMGNIKHQNLNEIYKNPNYSNFRKQVFTNRTQINMCKNCTE